MYWVISIRWYSGHHRKDTFYFNLAKKHNPVFHSKCHAWIKIKWDIGPRIVAKNKTQTDRYTHRYGIFTELLTADKNWMIHIHSKGATLPTGSISYQHIEADIYRPPSSNELPGMKISMSSSKVSLVCRHIAASIGLDELNVNPMTANGY